MALLVFIRHGQAGTYDGEYDRLSALGERQMATLGRYWGERKRRIDRVFVGPLVRQRRSLESFEQGLSEAGGAIGARHDDPGLVEYEGLAMVNLAVPRIIAEDPVVQAEAQGIAAGGAARRRHQERLFQHVSRRWVRGELDLPEVKPFAAFRRAVDGAIDRMMAASDNGQTTLAFTSGGVVAAALGRALGLADERVLELSWIVKNAAYTELLYNAERMTLFGFNAIPHLDPHPELVTLR